MNEAVEVEDKHDAHVEAYKVHMVMQIISAAMEASKGKPDVFVSYSPHVDSIGVDIYNEGWKADTPYDYSANTYLSWENSVENLQEMLNVIKAF